MNIEFNYSIDEYKLFDEQKVRSWIIDVIGEEKKIPGEIVYSFVNDEEILEVNQNFLNHDYFTDIITFDRSFVNIINGDLFVSIETVRTNSQILKNSENVELLRVIIHGIMHLCGYKDSSDKEKKEMRELEDRYLSYLERL